MAKCAGGRIIGVMGKLQTHLITTFFHAMPPVTIASQPSNTGAKSTAASSSSNPVKLAHQHNWASQAGPRTQSTSAADHTITSPAGQQCVGKRPSPPSPGDMGDTIYGMNVSFIDHLDIGLSVGAVLLLLFLIAAFCTCRKGLCLKWILGKRFMHLHQPPPPAIPSNQQCTLHGSHRFRPEPPPGPDGRRDRGPPEAEPVD